MSAFLGGVQHPINILQEYLTAFGNKCQAAILSWLDNWTKTKRKEGGVRLGLARTLRSGGGTWVLQGILFFVTYAHYLSWVSSKDNGQNVGLLIALGSTALFLSN